MARRKYNYGEALRHAGSAGVVKQIQQLSASGLTLPKIDARTVARDRTRIGEAYPTIMASPPTIGAISAANAATSIASGVDYLTVNAGQPGGAFTYVGRHEAVSTSVRAFTIGVGINGFSGTTNTTHIEWMTDAPNFEVRLRGTGQNYRYRVDGQLVEAGLRADAPGDSQSYRQMLTFGGSAVRRISIEGTGVGLIGVRVPNGYSVWPAVVGGPKWVTVADSYGPGNNMPASDGGPMGSFAWALPLLLGFPNSVQVGVPSTGLLNDNTGTRPTYIQRAAEIMAEKPAVVAIHGSINDNTFSSQVGAASTALYAALRAIDPDVVLIHWSPVNYNGGATANTNTPIQAAAIQAAAAAAGVVYADLSTFWNGTGRVGATIGDGNRDRYLGSDGTHPSLDGHKSIAYRLAGLLEPKLQGTRVA